MISATKSQLWRFGSIVVLCGLPLLLLGLTATNFMEASETDERTAQQTTTLTAIVAQLEKHRARAMTPDDTASLYLASASGSLAQAEIQALATKLVSDAGGRLAEVQPADTPEQESDGTVALQLSLDIDNKGLLDLLYAIETGLPLLSVTDLSARKNNDQSDDKPNDNGPLRVDMTVRGHWRKSTG